MKLLLEMEILGDGLLLVSTSVIYTLACAQTYWGGVERRFSKHGSLFRHIFLKHGCVFQKLAKNGQKWVVFPPKFIIRVGMTETVGN